MTRYVPRDLEQVGAELARRATEIVDWLEVAATRPSTTETGLHRPVPDAVAQVDQACVAALSATARRLVCAADSLVACAGTAREGDVRLAGLMRRW